MKLYMAIIGPETACGISGRVAGQAIRDWFHRKHHKNWQSTFGQKYAKGLPRQAFY
jgi:hypothetical protein